MWFKRYMQKYLMYYVLHDVIDLVNHRMIKNKKTLISWQRNIFFLRNKKNSQPVPLITHLRSYCFITEVTFNKYSNFKKLVRIASWLYVIIMSRKSFRVNLHSKVCLNVKELLAWSRHHIWSLSDSNKVWTHNHLVCKRTLNHLPKMSRVFVYELSGCGFECLCCHLNHILGLTFY